METDKDTKEVSAIHAVLIAVTVFSLALALIFGMVVGLYLNPILNRIDKATTVSECNARANAGVWQAIADSLDVPPAPAAARSAAVAEIRNRAKEFHLCQ